MRLTLALIALAVLGAGFVVHHRKAELERHLGDVASKLGDRRVHVHCQGFTASLVDVSSEGGTVQFDASGAPADTTDLKRPICQALKRFPHDASGAAYGCVIRNGECLRRIWEDVLAVHTLAHEVWHLHGIVSEAQTECYALQTTAQAASLLGADSAAAQATASYALAQLYPAMPDEYRGTNCVDGGPLDLRADDPHWP
jgi:hypothetical protein